MTPARQYALGAALAYAMKELGGTLVENESNPTIGAAVGTVIEGAGDRVGLIIVNVGTQDLFVSFNSAVSSTNGIKLGSAGGFLAMNVRDDFTLCSRKVYGIAPGGNTNVYVLEIVRSVLGG